MKVWDKQLINLQEQVYILFLNGANEVISWKCINTGTSDGTYFDLKMALACSIGCMASKIIIAHNHTSGGNKPSQADILVTERLYNAATLIDIKLTDHLIISSGGYYSFMDNFLLNI